MRMEKEYQKEIGRIQPNLLGRGRGLHRNDFYLSGIFLSKAHQMCKKSYNKRFKKNGYL